MHGDLAGFDFAQSKVDRRLIIGFATTSFTKQAENIVLIGGTGTGKTHVATTLGIEAVTQHSNACASTPRWNGSTRSNGKRRAGRPAGWHTSLCTRISSSSTNRATSHSGALLFHLLSKLYEHTSVDHHRESGLCRMGKRASVDTQNRQLIDTAKPAFN